MESMSHFYSRGRKTCSHKLSVCCYCCWHKYAISFIPFFSSTQSECQDEAVIIYCLHVCEHFNVGADSDLHLLLLPASESPINHDCIIIISSPTDGLMYSATVIFIGYVTQLRALKNSLKKKNTASDVYWNSFSSPCLRLIHRHHKTHSAQSR